MQISFARELAQYQNYETLYTSYNQEANKIASEGCQHLANGKWPNLQILDLCYKLNNLVNNKIDDKACYFLSLA